MILQFGYMKNLLMIFKSSQISSLLAGLWEDVKEEKEELMFCFTTSRLQIVTN